jgi:hypothetical protein
MRQNYMGRVIGFRGATINDLRVDRDPASGKSTKAVSDIDSFRILSRTHVSRYRLVSARIR